MKPEHERAKEIGERLREMAEARTTEEISTWWDSIDQAAANAPDFPEIRYSHARVKELMRVYGNLIKGREFALQGLANALAAILKNGMSADEARLCMVACNAPAMSNPNNPHGVRLHARCDQITRDERAGEAALLAAKPFLPEQPK